jgi:hypothetical protein
MVTARQHARRIHLRRRALHLIRDQDPEVALHLGDRLQQLLRLLRGLQLHMLVRLDLLAHVGLELLGVVEVLDALLADLAGRARTLGGGELARVVEVLVVLGVETDLANGDGDARRADHEATVDGVGGPNGGFTTVAALLVEEVGDVGPLHVLLIAQRLDEVILGILLDVALGASRLVGRLQHWDIVFDLGLDGASALESVHAGGLAEKVLGGGECTGAFDHEDFVGFGELFVFSDEKSWRVVSAAWVAENGFVEVFAV